MKKALVSLMMVFVLLAGICSFAAAEDEPVKLHAIASLHASTLDLETLPIYQEIAEIANVDIDWEYYRTDWNSKKNLILAGGDLPDFFFGGGTLTPNDIQMNKEYFIPLEDLIRENAPHIQAMLDEYPLTVSATTFPDGHMYSLPHYVPAKPAFNAALCINTKWLEKLNLKMPTTIEELTEVARHFVNDDPNGNGLKDEIGFEFAELNSSNFGARAFIGAFGVYDGIDDWLSVHDGTVVYNPATEGFKAWVSWLHQLHEEGLVDSEMLTQDFDQYKAKARRGGSTAICGILSSYELSQLQSDEYGILLPPVGPDGSQHLGSKSVTGRTGNLCCLTITTACKDPAAVIRWADQFYTAEYGIQACYGAYGVSLQKNEDGSIIRIAPEGQTVDNWTWTNSMNGNYVGFVPKEVEEKLVFDDQWYQRGVGKFDFEKAYLPYMDESHNYPKLILDTDDAVEVTMINTDLQSLWQSFAAKWITEGGIDEEWDSYLNELNRAGLERYLEIYQDAYEAHQ